MKAFTGTFFCVTDWSKYRVTIPEDLSSRPEVKKWSSRASSYELGKELHVPVTGTLIHGYYLAITALGLFQYNMPLGHQGQLLPIELIPGLSRGKITNTTPIVALFLDEKSAEDCFLTTADRKEVEPFASNWWNDTKTVLLALGMEHPLVSISTSSNNRFGVPRYLWSEHEPLPFEALARSSGT